MIKRRIVVVEDDRDIAELIQYNLEHEGWLVRVISDGSKVMEAVRFDHTDIIILDLMLPNVDGLDICRMLKSDEQTKDIPVLMLTAKSEDADVVVGLRMGADDYMTKPFSPGVLIARVKALLRRSKASVPVKDEVRTLGELTLDLAKHKVTYGKLPLKLTTIEFSILEFLSRSPGRVFTREQLLNNVWKEGKFIIDRAVDVHIRGLRKQLGAGSNLIETVRGVGYRFKDMDEINA